MSKTNSTQNSRPLRPVWHVPSSAPRNVDDLSFTSRNEKGFFCWWDVTPPKTSYWHVHEMLGRAYAFELLDLINNPDRDTDPDRDMDDDLCPHTLSYIAAEIVRRGHTMSDGLYIGFFDAISEYLIQGEVNR